MNGSAAQIGAGYDIVAGSRILTKRIDKTGARPPHTSQGAAQEGADSTAQPQASTDGTAPSLPAAA